MFGPRRGPLHPELTLLIWLGSGGGDEEGRRKKKREEGRRRRKKKERRRRKEGAAPLLKSRDLYLAGGDIHVKAGAWKYIFDFKT